MGRKLQMLLVAATAALVVVGGTARAQKAEGRSGAMAGKGASAESKGSRSKSFEFITADQVQFSDVPDMQGIQTAQLWGDMSKDGDWGALFKFKAGTDSGWHFHSNAIHLVAISGTLTIEPEGAQPTELRQNAYVDEPPKVKHRTTCKGDEDCVFFLHMEKRFDFKPVKDAGAAAK